MTTASFTGRIKTLELNSQTPVGTIYSIISWQDIGIKHAPQNALIDSWSSALTQLQCNYYLPGIYTPLALPETDEISQTIVEQLANDFNWKQQYSPDTGYAIELGLYEKFGNDPWQPLTRKWLYNQGLERYDDLLNPYLNSAKATDYGDIISGYQVGVAITKKPTQQTALEELNYIRIRCAYSGVVEFRELPIVKTLQSNSDSFTLIKNQVTQLLGENQNRKLIYLSNTGDSNLYFNFDPNLIGIGTSGLLKPGDVLSYESGKFTWSGEGKKFIPPMAEALIPNGLWVVTDGKTPKGSNGSKFTCSVLEMWG